MSDKRYYWLKLKRDFFKRHDIQIIESMPNGKDYVLFYLKLLAESIDHEGMLRFNDLIPYSEQMLSTVTNTNVDVVRSAITLLKQLDLIEILDDQTIFIKDTAKMLGEGSSTERVRRFRERKSQKLLTENVTETLRETEIEKEIEKEIDTELEKDTISPDKQAQALRKKTKEKRVVENPLFVQFYSCYPKKVAKPAAEKAFMRLKVDETLLTEMLAALEKWKRSKGWTKDNGEFIPNPATWLNQRRWEDDIPAAGNINGQNFEGQTYTAEEIKGFECDPVELLKMYTERKGEA